MTDRPTAAPPPAARHGTLRLAALLAAALPALGPAAAAEAPAPEPDERAHVLRNGVAVDFSIAATGEGTAGRPLLEGDRAEVRFRLVDTATGQPVTGVKPAAWLDVGQNLQGQGGQQRECKDKVGLYLKGIVGIRPMVDLNASWLLVLNQDPSISVIDPVVSMTGRTSLYATVVLKRPPADWAKSADSKRLWVSLPQAGEVAVVDAEAFKVLASVPAGPVPVRVALQPGGARLWVGNDAEGGAGGVTVLDTATDAVLASIPTGRGHHELAFSPDGRLAFVSNREQGTVTVIDAARLEEVKTLATGPLPISLAVSPLSQALYVADGKAGAVAVVDLATLAVTARLPLEPGLGPLRVTPDGRWVFATNAAARKVFVLDAASGRVAHAIALPGAPYQVTFTRAFAYLRLLDSARVVMVNLGSLGGDRAPIAQGFEAGAGAPQAAGEPGLADAVAQSSLDAAVYVVNPADDTVSFYMEGMNAPMGSYGAYGHAARAVTVVDRSLKAVEPGVYAAALRLPVAGRYDVAFLLENPRVLHCFSAEVAPDPKLRKALGALAIEYVGAAARAPAGAPLTVRFRLLDPVTRAPRPGLAGVRAVAYLAPGQLRTELAPREVEPGLYEATFTPSRPGAWYFNVLVPSLTTRPSDLPFHTVIVGPVRPAGPASPDGRP